MFDYDGSLQSAIAALKRERRYRVFADLERKVGLFPHNHNSIIKGPARRPLRQGHLAP
jgi:hypothetical protein